VLVTECVSALIPDDWVIVVKENPKQTSYMRRDLFFERMDALPKVRWIPRHFNTYELLRHAQFAVTISGTVGWEAITGGKPVLVFGRTWYHSLPGVVPYRHDLRLEDVMGQRIDHAELEHGTRALQTRMGVGVVDRDYRVLVKDFDPEQNAKMVVDSVMRLLATRP
jgi:capsule polysaccharide export protein KpsC/LpsZ